MKRNEAARVFDASEKERKLKGRGEKQPIFPVEEPEDTDMPPAAKMTSLEEFDLAERQLQAEEKRQKELAVLRANMANFINEAGTTLINLDKPGSVPEDNFEDTEEMGRINEIFGVIEQSGLDSATVEQLFETLENLIIAITPDQIDQEKIDQIIEVIEASELEPTRRQELILELKNMIATAVMDMDDASIA
ncbi:MAG: hypothetical protein WC693_02950 [Patescibacteria group bacterium]|jgi:hypothetical protein